MWSKNPIKNNDMNIAGFHIKLVDLPEDKANIYVISVPIIITEIPTIVASSKSCKL